jgi:hypothetical protein
VQALDEDHAGKPLHQRQREAEVLVEQQIDRTVAAEDQLHRDRADEGRHDQRQDAERLDQSRAAELEAHGDVRERHCDQRGDRDTHRRDVQGIRKGLAHQRDLEERAEVAERERAVGVAERSDEHGADGNQQQQQQEAEHARGERERAPAGVEARAQPRAEGAAGRRRRSDGAQNRRLNR